jgi:hypothetical protein
MIFSLIDPNLCIHHKTNETKVNIYQKSMAKGDIFPAVEVLFHKEKYYVRDGAHRVNAARELGYPVLAEVYTIDNYPNLWLLGKRFSWELEASSPSSTKGNL